MLVSIFTRPVFTVSDVYLPLWVVRFVRLSLGACGAQVRWRICDIPWLGEDMSEAVECWS
jgi:hypothetical protein